MCVCVSLLYKIWNEFRHHDDGDPHPNHHQTIRRHRILEHDYHQSKFHHNLQLPQHYLHLYMVNIREISYTVSDSSYVDSLV